MAVEKRIGRFTFVCYSPGVDGPLLLQCLAGAGITPGKGRGGIKEIELGGQRLVARQYTHGGLFRRFTGDRFWSGRRAVAEAEVTDYLHSVGFPVVRPFCVVVERRGLTRRLHLITFLEEGAVDLFHLIRVSSQRQRLRIARLLGESFWMLQRAGVFHPDLHLRNVIAAPDGRLVFLDFDRAQRKTIARSDMRRMFKRLGRFVDKMERQGELSVSTLEKTLFLRSYARLSGYDPTAEITQSARRDRLRYRVGWLAERLLYREKR
jgi:tRNA A-37 threonylcarbamoyl transferase component Bud32